MVKIQMSSKNIHYFGLTAHWLDWMQRALCGEYAVPGSHLTLAQNRMLSVRAQETYEHGSVAIW